MSFKGHRRTLPHVHAMSALGQKQTHAAQKGMSAFPPKATSNATDGMSAKAIRGHWSVSHLPHRPVISAARDEILKIDFKKCQ